MKKLKLYKISQDIHRGYDVYDSAVVCAEDEKEARYTSPGHIFDYTWNEKEERWINLKYPNSRGIHKDWTTPDNVKVRLIGIAEPSIKKGVVVASDNAG